MRTVSALILAKKITTLARALLLTAQEEVRRKLDMPIPQDIRDFSSIFKNSGYKLYVVGGAVRDALLGKTPKDYDLVTDAIPDKVEEILQNSGYKTLPTGKSFGVITVVTDTDNYEIATFREDIGSGRRPDAVKFTDIASDVKRRDLTINALFYDLETGEVVDLVNGIADLEAGRIKTVGTPQDRFGEDRLRILRALRFAGRFGSDLDPEVDRALMEDSALLGVSPERIRDEFLKGISSSKSVLHFLGLLRKYDMFDSIFPGLEITDITFESKDPIIVIASLLSSNDPKNIPSKLNSLKYKTEEAAAIAWLILFQRVNMDNVISLKKALKKIKITPEQVQEFSKHAGMSSSLVSAFLRFDLVTDAGPVMEKFGLKPGKDLGTKMDELSLDNFKELL